MTELDRNFGESQILHIGLGLLAPSFEDAPIAEFDEVAFIDVELACNDVNPLTGTFELGIKAERGLIENAISLLVCPLGAPLLIDKNRLEAQALEYFAHRRAILDRGLGFHPALVPFFGILVVRNTLVRDLPFASGFTNAQDLRRIAQLALRRVIERIALEGSGDGLTKAELPQILLEALTVGNADFYFRFHRLHKRQSIPASRAWENGKDREDKGNLAESKTLRLRVDANALHSPDSEDALRQAAGILRSGGTVAFPTETVYGLGANAFDAAAVRRVFEAKQRPSWDPLIVHVSDAGLLDLIVKDVPAKARLLMDAFWPGPITLLLRKSDALPAIVTAGRPKVGVRMPKHPVAHRLIELAQLPIAAPSANSFGRTSSTRAEFVLEDLDGRIDAVIDSGASSLGLESTVVDVCDEPPVLYRPGMITFEQIEAICGTLVRYRAAQETSAAPESQPSPGTGLKHYAPRARLILFEIATAQAAFELADKLSDGGERVGIMLPDDLEAGMPLKPTPSNLVYRWGKWADGGELARRLFAGLRELDHAGVDVILCPLPEEKGVGSAIRDRLLKAAQTS